MMRARVWWCVILESTDTARPVPSRRVITLSYDRRVGVRCGHAELECNLW